jgi:site-specific recombinase XerD
MIIRIVQSKGRKDRHVMLPAEVLELLRQWWKARPTACNADGTAEQRWLFPGRRAQPLTTRQFGRLFKEAAKAAALRKTVSLHSLRHYVSFLTMSGNSEAPADLIGNVGSSRAQVLPITQHSFGRIQESNWRVS